MIDGLSASKENFDKERRRSLAAWKVVRRIDSKQTCSQGAVMYVSSMCMWCFREARSQHYCRIKSHILWAV